MQSKLSLFHFRPDTSLHLDDSEEAGLATPLKSLDRLGQGLVGIEVENRDPLRLCAARRRRPLFDNEVAVWHRPDLLSVVILVISGQRLAGDYGRPSCPLPASPEPAPTVSCSEASTLSSAFSRSGSTILVVTTRQSISGTVWRQPAMGRCRCWLLGRPPGRYVQRPPLGRWLALVFFGSVCCRLPSARLAGACRNDYDDRGRPRCGW